MTTLVTGGTGFIGLPIVRSLVEEGERPVIYDLVPNMKPIEDLSDKVKLVRGDILDMPNFLRTIKEHDVDKIVHLVYMGDTVIAKNAYNSIDINLRGTTNVFEAARILDVDRVVWASSGAVYAPAAWYGGQQAVMDEDKPVKPGSMYGANKVMDEFIGEFYGREYGMDIIALRLTSVYGAGRHHSAFWTGEIIENPAKGKPAKIPMAAAEEHDFVYVKDTTSAFMLALKVKKHEHNIFNISGGTYRLRDIAAAVKDVIPDAVIEFEDAPLVNRVSRFSVERARKELGWDRKFTLKEAVRDMIGIVKSMK